MDCHKCLVGNTKKIVGSTPEPSLIKGLIVKLDAKDYSRKNLDIVTWQANFCACVQ